MRILRQPSTVTTMIGQKQLKNVESFKCLGTILTNDGRCARKIKLRISMAKAASKRRRLFYQHMGLEIEEETSKMLHLEHGFACC
jgi:hypothetical protein